MIYEVCFFGMELEQDTKSVIDACLQALTIEQYVFINVLNDISVGESTGTEMAGIIIEGDCEDTGCQNIEGVCFNYIDKYVVVSFQQANEILERCIKMEGIDYDWKGIPAA